MRHLFHLRLLYLTFALSTLHCSGGDSQDGDANSMQQPAASSNNPSGSMTTGSDVPAGDTWGSFAQGFFVSYCVSCHNDDNRGDAERDLHQRSVVDTEAEEIACGLSKSTPDWSARGCSGFPPARQFPAGNGPNPSDAERDRLVAWIDAARP